MANTSQNTVSTVPNVIYQHLLFTTTSLLDNWELGKEHEDFYKELTERSGELIHALKNCPEMFEYPIQSIAIQLGEDKAKDAFKIRVKKGSCTEAALLTDAFLIYDAKNDFDELLIDLDGLIAELNNQQATSEVDRILSLRTEAEELYTREYDKIVDKLEER
jgi:hypothetical protein